MLLCLPYSSLAGRENDTYPHVQVDRFRRSVLVRELDGDTALIEDGRGTRLVVAQWRTISVVPAGPRM